MEEYLNVLKSVQLFRDLNEKDILSVLNCLAVKIETYKKDSIVIDENSFNIKIGIVLSGTLQNMVLDYDGAKSIVAVFNASDMFAESLVCAAVTAPPFTVIATAVSTILFLDYKKILAVCNHSCQHHLILISNMLKILASKNLYLNKKLRYVTKRTTKEKLLSYLTEFSKECGSKTFTIPFNRQELADFLAVDRSAMSTELSKLQTDNIILNYNKNRFILK